MKRNILMVAGPTEIEEDVRMAGSLPMVYNRTTEFGAFILDLEKSLKVLFKTKNDVFILASSGTGAMECAVVNFLSPGDEALILIGGTFGRRWLEIAQRYGIVCRTIEVEQGESVSPELIQQEIREQTKAVFVTANETSTGVLIDLETIGDYVHKTKAIFVVDAVSSLAADPIETDAWHCDVVITAGQKALAIPPGISFISVSNKAWNLTDSSTIPKYYFDIKAYRENMRRGQTPFTPPISLLYQLHARLGKMMMQNLDNLLAAQRNKSEYLQKGLKELGLQIIGKKPSNGVVGILFPESIDAFHVITRLRHEYGIEITPSPGADKCRIARIGLFGDIDMHEINKLLEGLKNILFQPSPEKDDDAIL